MTRRSRPDVESLSRMGAKPCSMCGLAKPLDSFRRVSDSPPRYLSWCRACERIYAARRYHSQEGSSWRAEYLARPDVKARRKADQERARHGPRRRARVETYRRSLIGRLRHSRSATMRRLRAATDPARIARLEQLVALYDREIARITREAS